MARALGLTVLAISIGASAVFVTKMLPPRASGDMGFMRSGDSVPAVQRIVAAATPVDSIAGDGDLTIFVDYECPQCKALHDTLDGLTRRTGTGISVRVIHFPQSAIHPHAFAASVGFACAAKFGNAGRAHRQLFSGTDSLTPARIQLAALEGMIGNTRDSVRVCIKRADTRDVVSANSSLAKELRVPGTPATVIAGRIWLGAIHGDSILSLLRMRYASP